VTPVPASSPVRLCDELGLLVGLEVLVHAAAQHRARVAATPARPSDGPRLASEVVEVIGSLTSHSSA
jgi:hypothetical protein